MGSPDFAIPVLDTLLQSEHDVVSVVTVPDKLGGRSMNQVLESPVKKFAKDRDIPILQPHKLNGSRFLNQLRKLEAEVFVVVAFRKLPKLVWAMPPKGTINIHASLLPKYRGAAPINWAVISGETETGLTTFYINEKIDTGEIIDQVSCPIKPDDTAGEVYLKLMKLSGPFILKTLDKIVDPNFKPHPQSNALASAAPKVFFDQNEIDFSQSTFDINNFIRGMSPYPCAWIKFEQKVLKIYRAKPVIEHHQEERSESVV